MSKSPLAWIDRQERFAILAASAPRDRAAAAFGAELHAAGEADQAAKAYAHAIDLKPTDGLYWSNYGVALDAAGKPDKAIEALEKALEINPAQPQIILNLAAIRIKRGQFTVARGILEKATAHRESAAEAWIVLGRMALRQNDFVEAALAFDAAITVGATDGLVFGELGAARFQLGDVEGARGAYAEAAARRPDRGITENLAFLEMLAGVLAGRADQAITDFARPLTDDNALKDALHRAVMFLSLHLQPQAAAALTAEWMQYYPDDIEPRYLHAALSGEPLKRAPPAYVAALFDRLAPVMDQALLASIDYKVPKAMAELVTKSIGPEWRGEILDAGCGTGAFGREIKHMATRLDGVDLSPAMARAAMATGLYASVEREDAIVHMNRSKESYDGIAAADMLFHTGTLEPFFSAAGLALRKSGWLAISVETLEGRKAYRLMPNGHFRHSAVTVKLAAAAGFRLIAKRSLALRKRASQPVAGWIYLFQRAS